MDPTRPFREDSRAQDLSEEDRHWTRYGCIYVCICVNPYSYTYIYVHLLMHTFPFMCMHTHARRQNPTKVHVSVAVCVWLRAHAWFVFRRCFDCGVIYNCACVLKGSYYWLLIKKASITTTTTATKRKETIMEKLNHRKWPPGAWDIFDDRGGSNNN